MDKIMSFDDYLALGNDGSKAIIGDKDATLNDGNGATNIVNNGYLESEFGEIDPDTLVPDLNTGLGVDGKHHSYVGGVQVISDDGSSVGEQIEWPEVYLKESFSKIKLDELSINEARELDGILKRFHEAVDPAEVKKVFDNK